MKRLYLDMDGVLVDFDSGVARLGLATRLAYAGHLDDVPGIFALMKPMPGAIDAFAGLAKVFDTYILSTAPWRNPSAWADKVVWVQEHLGPPAQKRLILSHHKDLLRGDFLVDDRTAHGADRFEGAHLQFGTPMFADWPAIITYLLGQAGSPGDGTVPRRGHDSSRRSF